MPRDPIEDVRRVQKTFTINPVLVEMWYKKHGRNASLSDFLNRVLRDDVCLKPSRERTRLEEEARRTRGLSLALEAMHESAKINELQEALDKHVLSDKQKRKKIWESALETLKDGYYFRLWRAHRDGWRYHIWSGVWHYARLLQVPPSRIVKRLRQRYGNKPPKPPGLEPDEFGNIFLETKELERYYYRYGL